MGSGACCNRHKRKLLSLYGTSYFDLFIAVDFVSDFEHIDSNIGDRYD